MCFGLQQLQIGLFQTTNWLKISQKAYKSHAWFRPQGTIIGWFWGQRMGKLRTILYMFNLWLCLLFRVDEVGFHPNYLFSQYTGMILASNWMLIVSKEGLYCLAKDHMKVRESIQNWKVERGCVSGLAVAKNFNTQPLVFLVGLSCSHVSVWLTMHLIWFDSNFKCESAFLVYRYKEGFQPPKS